MLKIIKIIILIYITFCTTEFVTADYTLDNGSKELANTYNISHKNLWDKISRKEFVEILYDLYIVYKKDRGVTIDYSSYSQLDNSKIFTDVKLDWDFWKKLSYFAHVWAFSKNEIFSIIFKNISEKTKLITSTGYNSREALNHNSKLIKKFYLVGGMGHTLAVSYGISLKDKKNKIICIDGDGSFFMHLGSFAMIKKKLNKNFKYILLDNGRHESVGNVKINFNLNIKDFAKNVGFSKYVLIDNKNKENIVLKYLKKYKGSAFIHIKTRVTKEDNLQRPKNLLNIKEEFLKNF